MGIRLVFFLFLALKCENILADEKPILNVYTYSSFANEWGPGPTIKKSFEQQCGCEVRFISVADGYSLLARLKLEKSSPKADVVVGLDETLTSAARETELFADTNINLTNSTIPNQVGRSSIFVPYDYGFYAFMFDTKAKNSKGLPFRRPTSMADLLESPDFKKSVIIQDPRSSAPGLALLLWLRAIYAESAPEKYPKLKDQVLTVSPGWSESYKLFTSGEAPLVFSYTTSEAYHREEENTDRYQALIFNEGHYVVVEYSAILKSSKQDKLAKKFLEFLTSDFAQATISSKNWMYPIRLLPKGTPKSYTQIPMPKTKLHINPDIIFKQRETWTMEWQKVFSKN